MAAYVRRILAARVYDVAIESPLDRLEKLSGRLDADIFLKREDLQQVFSFKLRGAYNKMANLDADSLGRGVICASAGNHAQGVALAASRLGGRAVIVMPLTTPGIKVQAVAALGGEVVLHGDGYDEAAAHARKIAAAESLTFIPPFDDPDVIAGQGTIGMEILRQHTAPIAAIFVPIGGGGLAAGIAAYVKFLRPETRIIGVEPDDAASMQAAIQADAQVTLDQVGLFADGVAVRRVGAETFKLCRLLLDEIITVDTDAVCAAIKDIFDETRSIAEPSGALGLAGLKKYREREGTVPGALIAINSGANLNFDRLRHIAERAEIGEHREALLAVGIPEQPGSYRRLIQSLGRRAVTEFNYRFAGGSQAQIFLGVALNKGLAEGREIAQALRAEGYSVVDLSDNEMAKVHARYMVGGRVEGIAHERIYRFQFPERPGALMKFLEGMSASWNITLFHYRNQGADYGRVLAGIQIPPGEEASFATYLERLAYPYSDETDNPAYALFLGASPAS
ncbi:threonine ammonia-lyase, biosynthetic [Arboricoccus pini]|uniref:threonine ammonia-lyase, biosynthetic n=1 Tax=Arboricoccus pini TaxID=1963835 RepID=UPI000B50FA36|nr:threonine ammonia-lyase, biosynthetic [Arboricoccus pini]